MSLNVPKEDRDVIVRTSQHTLGEKPRGGHSLGDTLGLRRARPGDGVRVGLPATQ